MASEASKQAHKQNWAQSYLKLAQVYAYLVFVSECLLSLTSRVLQELGFKGVESDCHIRFLPTPWPSDSLPPPTSLLLAVAPTKGIAVGGSPDGLVVATTKSIREAITARQEGVKCKPFTPQNLIPLPSRPQHIVFCAGENALAVSTQGGNQVVVYDAATLLQNNAQPRISISTNGPLRTMAANPAPSNEALSSYVAMVTTNGELLVADLKAGSLVSGSSGPVLRNGVASVAWSNRGKQLVAGLADGSCVQLDPQGAVKAEIPRAPQLEGNKHGTLLLLCFNIISLTFGSQYRRLLGWKMTSSWSSIHPTSLKMTRA